MKRKMKSLVAMGLTMAMLFSTSVFAGPVEEEMADGLESTTGSSLTGLTLSGSSNSITTEVNGTTTKKEPKYQVVLPTATGVSLALNPYQIEQTHQVLGNVAYIENKSDVPIQVSCTLSNGSSSATNLTYVDNEADVNQKKTDETEKQIYLGVYFAKTVNLTTKKATMLETPSFSIGQDGAKFDLLLQNEGKDSVAAAFKVMGSMNPYASWSADDVKMKLVYSFNGVPTEVFKEQVLTGNGGKAQYIDDAVGLAKVDTTKNITIKLTTADWKTFATEDTTVLFGESLAKVTKVLYAETGTDVTSITKTAITANGTYGKATVSSSGWIALAKALKMGESASSKTITAKLLSADGLSETPYNITINISKKE